MEVANSTLDKILVTFSSIIKNIFHIIIGLCNILVTLIFILGAASSMILLFKMFPEIFISLYDAVLPFFEILGYLIILFIVLFVILLFCLGVFGMSKIIDMLLIELETNRKKKEKKFINEIVSKLKKEKIK